MTRLGLIADDLTGAMDTGLQFSKCGLETTVALSWRQLPGSEVVVVDTDTREARASEARERMLTVAGLLRGRAIYKKVDSTLRGNVGYELRALADALHPRCIVVAPAFPRSGRTTLGGVQRVAGKPLELTPFARDPRWPMRESHLPTLLMQQAGREVGQVGLEWIARGPEDLATHLRSRPESLVVVDALEQAHLRTIAQALVRLGPEALPCGSAGLAEEWVEALGIQRDEAPPGPVPGAGPVLAVSGSRNDVAVAQIARAREELCLEQVDLDPRRCYDAEREIARLSAACLAELAKGRDVILSASNSLLIAGAGALVARVLADSVALIASRVRLGGLFLTGGDIAVTTCRALGVSALRIATEVQPGIPGGQLLGGRWEGLWVVTKAGGFGNDRALLDALAYLHGPTF